MNDITIVYVNYLSKDDIYTSIKSLIDDISESKFKIKIVVVDNSQNKDCIKETLLDFHPIVSYIDVGKNVGFGKGNNIGFSAYPARYYFALNRDTFIPKNSKVIDSIINFMDENKKIGCMGPKLINTDGSLQETCYRFNFQSIFIKPLKQINFDKKYKWVKKYSDQLVMKDFDHNKTIPVDWVLGAAMIVRKETADQVGFFDERFFMYLEDSDWCRRMWEKGWPVYYVHDIIIKHAHERGSSKVPGVFKALFKNKLARIHLISWFKYMLKWHKNFKYYGVS